MWKDKGLVSFQGSWTRFSPSLRSQRGQKFKFIIQSFSYLYDSECNNNKRWWVIKRIAWVEMFTIRTMNVVDIDIILLTKLCMFLLANNLLDMVYFWYQSYCYPIILLLLFKLLLLNILTKKTNFGMTIIQFLSLINKDLGQN